MKFQLISIFPEFFDVLRLSLLGKAVENGVLSWEATNLRDFTTDPHRSVDDTPYGGGAGMVMRADIWGKAIDAALDHCEGCAKVVLAIPTPSGVPLTQAKVREIASGAENVIVACGRYEGIDSRVAAHYRNSESYRNLEVLEYSLGDYVLNGGEIAAVALVEAVGRLLDGTVGNPDSLVEESFEGSGLLEYPSFTRPETWRDIEVPQVLQGGNHKDIARWRSAKAIEKTARVRPELLKDLDVAKLTKRNREQIAGYGWVYLPKDSEDFIAKQVTIRKPDYGEAMALSALGSETFPLACPSFVTPEEIDQFTAQEFDLEAVKARLEDPEHHRYLVAEVEGELVGYTYAITGMDDSRAVEVGIAPGDVYLSKCYVREAMHGTGLAGALLEAALADLGVVAVSLGTSVFNKRAQKFYKRHGFKKVGTRTFMVGGRENQDVVMRRSEA